MKIFFRRAFTFFMLPVATLIVAPSVIVASLFPGSANLGFRLMKLWAWLVAGAMGLTYSMEGAEKLDPRLSYIIAANHQSHVDSLALALLLPVRFRWTMKKELKAIPLFGWALTRTGAISLDRSKGGEAIRSLQQQSGATREGWSILVYPEGTRSYDGKLRRFKKGAFALAVHSGVPIVPITVNGSFKILPRNTYSLRPGHIKVIVGDPIETSGLTRDDVPTLMERTHSVVLGNLDESYDPFHGDKL